MSNFLNQKTYAQATKNQPVAKPSLFERTVQPVRDQKLPYDNERETEGDGNCFYNAIIDQIENNPTVAKTLSDEAKRCSNPQELREKVIDFINDWPSVLDTLLVSRDFMIEEFRKKGKLPSHYPQEIIWQQFLLPKQKESGVYAEDLIIQCTPTFLSKDIYVISQGSTNNRSNQTKWLRLPSFTGTSSTPITLASNQSPNSSQSGGEHFQSLIPHPTVSIDSSVCRNCAKPTGKYLRRHLNQSKIGCHDFYDKDLLEQEAKERVRQNKAKYNAKNQSQICTKQADYNAKNQSQICKKQADYNAENRRENSKKKSRLRC